MRAELVQSLRDGIANARREGRSMLHEIECYPFVTALGLAVPRHVVVRDAAEAAALDLASFPGDRLVLKIVSQKILHRSDIGGVRVVPRESSALQHEIVELERRLDCPSRSGFSIHEYVAYDRSPGGELLLGLRWTADFGPVLTLGPGGVYTEWLSRVGRDVNVTLGPLFQDADELVAVLESRELVRLVTGGVRGQPPRLTVAALAELVGRLFEFAGDWMPRELVELEVNPLALTPAGPVALDGLIRIADGPPPPETPRPLDKLPCLLRPRSIALIGVAQRMNPGHVILCNILREGFDPRRIHVIKPGARSIEGCRCVDSVADLPEPVDLLILGLEAAEAPQIVEQVCRSRNAESIILIPGGLGERPGTEPLARAMVESLERSRGTAWRGPLINGGNCLGIRSRPGRYDTTFIPEYKLPPRGSTAAPLAVISQSGALSLAQLSKLGSIEPAYLVSVGNQIDLTVGDYLEVLADDPDLAVFACYVEGFRPRDGQRWLRAARKIRAAGRHVVLYHAGRTAQGARASATHTASIVGDHEVTRELARQAGVVVAETLSDFEELIRLFVLLREKSVAGWRLGALSNAGFECVAIADHAGRFELPPFSASGAAAIEGVFSDCRLHRIVAVHNPLDVNPTMHDEAFAEVARLMLDDAAVDVGIIGCVPMTGALQTLPGAGEHEEELLRADSVVQRLARLGRQQSKAWVAVVDGGAQYDAMAQFLTQAGVPAFRSADRAARIFERYCAARLAAWPG